MLYCNAGKAIVTQKGDLRGYGTVWYCPEGIANILSIKNKYIVREYTDASKARSIQDRIGRASTKDYIRHVENNMLPNCPIKKADIICAEDILGAKFGIIKRQKDKSKAIKSNNKHIQ